MPPVRVLVLNAELTAPRPPPCDTHTLAHTHTHTHHTHHTGVEAALALFPGLDLATTMRKYTQYKCAWVVVGGGGAVRGAVRWWQWCCAAAAVVVVVLPCRLRVSPRCAVYLPL